MKFKSYIEEEFNEIRESLDSPTKIYKTEKEDDNTFYYFDIGDKEFRAIIEKVDDESAIIFEQKINDAYSYEGIQNNLSKAESLSLFSTLKTLVKYLKTRKNYIYTDDKKKLKLYLKILKTIKEVKSVNYFDEEIPYIIGFGLDKDLKQLETDRKKFKFKFWK